MWEAAVKSAKHHLVRVTNGQSLNYEEYQTVFSNIKCILNSRSLCYRQSSNSSPELLTPGHFLTGSSCILSTPEQSSIYGIPLTKRYEIILNQIESFWKVWSKDYLNQIRNRTKWKTIHPNLQANDVVLIKERNSKLSAWILGIIEETMPDQDGIVRIATVRTNHGLKRQAISNLIPLTSREPEFGSPGGVC